MDTSLKKGESATLLLMYPGTALRLTQCGLANGFLQRRNGKRRPGEQKVRSTPGGMSLMVSYAIARGAALTEPLKWTNSRKGEAPLDVSTWREMSGSGLIVGMGKNSYTGCCGVVLGSTIGSSPAVLSATETSLRRGASAPDFVAPGLYNPLHFYSFTLCRQRRSKILTIKISSFLSGTAYSPACYVILLTLPCVRWTKFRYQ